MKYEAISFKSNEFPVKKIREEIRMVKIIETVFLESDKTYGYRTIKEELIGRGINVSVYKIRKIMRKNGLYPETRKKYKPYKKGKNDGKYYENLVKQNFNVEKKNQVWVGDITYLKTKLGWVYLAAVID